jgi:3-deoxy-7-phosphoheptulonate synthase
VESGKSPIFFLGGIVIVVMKQSSTKEDIEKVKEKAIQQGHEPLVIDGVERSVVAISGKVNDDHRAVMKLLPNVSRVIPVGKPYKLASKNYKDQNSIIDIKGLKVGGENLAIIAGPDSAETQEQTIETAIAAKEAGSNGLRGGAFKPRTSPYSFQGRGEDGLKMLKEASEITSLPLFSEIMDAQHLELMEGYVDVLQIGARNMQNFKLLEAVGESKLPVLLKRGMSATIEELLLASEYILSRGNENVMLCERGIRTYETATRNTFDINAIPFLKQNSHLPVIADPSHATGDNKLVEPVALAAIAAGADGLLIEIHPRPDEALCDGPQALLPTELKQLIDKASIVAQAVGRSI